MPRVYKILPAADWAEACRAERYDGSPDDARDGFIHLSLADQVPGTLKRHFSGRRDLLIVAFDADELGSAVRFEPSRQGALFPHHYGPINPARALATAALPDADAALDGLPKGFLS